MITKTTKTELKTKLFFDGEILIDSNGEEVDLIKQLKFAFGENEFELRANITTKSEYELTDSADKD